MVQDFIFAWFSVWYTKCWEWIFHLSWFYPIFYDFPLENSPENGFSILSIGKSPKIKNPLPIYCTPPKNLSKLVCNIFLVEVGPELYPKTWLGQTRNFSYYAKNHVFGYNSGPTSTKKVYHTNLERFWGSLQYAGSGFFIFGDFPAKFPRPNFPENGFSKFSTGKSTKIKNPIPTNCRLSENLSKLVCNIFLVEVGPEL